MCDLCVYVNIRLNDQFSFNVLTRNSTSHQTRWAPVGFEAKSEVNPNDLEPHGRISWLQRWDFLQWWTELDVYMTQGSVQVNEGPPYSIASKSSPKFGKVGRSNEGGWCIVKFSKYAVDGLTRGWSPWAWSLVLQVRARFDTVEGNASLVVLERSWRIRLSHKASISACDCRV